MNNLLIDQCVNVSQLRLISIEPRKVLDNAKKLFCPLINVTSGSQVFANL